MSIKELFSNQTFNPVVMFTRYKSIFVGIPVAILLLSLWVGPLVYITQFKEESYNDLLRAFQLTKLMDFDSKVSEVAKAVSLISPNKMVDKDRFALAAVIVKQADTYELDPLDILAVISYESEFNQKAVSKTGDYGLMGINWYWVGRFNVNKKTDLFDIETNVSIGAQELVYWREFMRKVSNKEGHFYFNHYNSGTQVASTRYSQNIKKIRNNINKKLLEEKR